MAGVCVQDVEKCYRGQGVLRKASMVCENGTITGIVGRNGSGKTVLLKTICGLVVPDSGQVVVEGKRIGRDLDFPESIGAIIESPGFLFSKSGLDNLRYLAGIRKCISDETIRDTMKLVGLDPASKKWVGRYSLGMRQRLGIAQAIMEDPQVLVLDEPMNGLDEDGVEDVRTLLLELKEQGKCILLASHNKEDIEILCDAVYEMNKGVLRQLR